VLRSQRALSFLDTWKLLKFFLTAMLVAGLWTEMERKTEFGYALGRVASIVGRASS
jgi:hypothetical protein